MYFSRNPVERQIMRELRMKNVERRMRQDEEKVQELQKIKNELDSRPELLGFMQLAMKCKPEQIRLAIEMLSSAK